MTKNKYHFPVSRLLGTLAIIGLAAIASSCGPTTATNTTPDWATGISDGTAPYYYFPDYGMYYDATAQQYYYPSNGAWVTSAIVPYQGVNLNDAYVVELNQNTQRPWANHDYYARNYPPHEREQYQQVVRDHNIIPNVPQNHTIVPRAYDENTDRMTFEERAQAQPAQQGARPGAQPAQQGARAQPQQQRVAVHQVPMQTIAPNMPAQARGYRYGGNPKGK